jgi:hypothetical protein
VGLVCGALVCLLYQPRMMDECGAVGGMEIAKETEELKENPPLMPHCPPQIPGNVIWNRTGVSAVGNRRVAV